jgi:hypothetical protein
MIIIQQLQHKGWIRLVRFIDGAIRILVRASSGVWGYADVDNDSCMNKPFNALLFVLVEGPLIKKKLLLTRLV